MRTPVSYRYVAQFACLQADCPDTCCQGWAMPTDAHQRAMYAEKAPQLLASIDVDGCFKQQTAGGFCVEFRGGICGIHARQGDQMLGDSCHFYPRVVRRLGDELRVGAQLSCPETVRLLLTDADPFGLVDTPLARLPIRLTDVKPDGLNGEEAMAVVDFFISSAGDGEASAATILRRLLAYANASPVLNTWHDWQMLDSTLPTARHQPTNPQMLLYALCLQIATAPRIARPQLDALVLKLQEVLGCRMDWDTRIIHPIEDAASRYEMLRTKWHERAADLLAPAMRRWIQAQLAIAAFPFGGAFARDRNEAMRLLTVRFATLQLVLMCHCSADGTPPSMAHTIALIQTLARFMDHIADADLLRQIYRDAGWSDLAGLSGLLEA